MRLSNGRFTVSPTSERGQRDAALLENAGLLARCGLLADSVEHLQDKVRETAAALVRALAEAKRVSRERDLSRARADALHMELIHARADYEAKRERGRTLVFWLVVFAASLVATVLGGIALWPTN